MPTDHALAAADLPLFPLQTVLFPDGLLGLTVFEARYLDLVTQCLRTRESFGVIGLTEAGKAADKSTDRATRGHAKAPAAPAFEAVGTRAELIDVDSERPGILLVRCRGGQRFRIASRQQAADGLWLARTEAIEDDEAVPPADALRSTVRALEATIPTLKNSKNESPFLAPYRFESAGWVANRWCEILPISQAAKQRLMELPDPTVRLELVDEFLRAKGVIK